MGLHREASRYERAFLAGENSLIHVKLDEEQHSCIDTSGVCFCKFEAYGMAMERGVSGVVLMLLMLTGAGVKQFGGFVEAKDFNLGR